MAQQWEYKVIESTDRWRLQTELNQMSADGWELVSATSVLNFWMNSVVVLFLKRGRPPRATV